MNRNEPIKMSEKPRRYGGADTNLRLIAVREDLGLSRAELALSITLDDDGVLRMSLGDESIEARIAVAQDEGWQSVDEDDDRA